MYTVLLVDDEALIREAISENIKWEELGFDFLGTCKNGKEAMEKIVENPPNLLLTDICMPYVDGMELTEFVYQNYPDTKVVIISGYDEFEYAKKAVKFQVKEYLLKPVTAFELSEILLKIKNEFDTDLAKKNSIQKIRGAYISNLPVLRGRFLNGLLTSGLPAQEIQEKMEQFQIHLEGRCFATVLIEGDDLSSFVNEYPEEKNDLGLFAIFNIADEIVRENHCGIAFQNAEDKTIVIFAGETEEQLTKQIESICKEIHDSIARFLHIDTTIGVGKIVFSIYKLSQSMVTTKQAIELKFLLGGNRIFYAKDLKLDEKDEMIKMADWTGKLILSMKTNNMKELDAQINTFIQELRNAYLSKTRIIIYIQNIVLSAMNALDSAGISDDLILSAEKQFLAELYNQKHLHDIGEMLKAFTHKVADILSDQRDSYGKKQALMALDYIDKNYKDAELSLNSVCSYLSISTSYFSSIFKNYTGETFVEALTKKRIEKAKELIENTSMKTYEIADEIGFSDPHYFGVIFKKQTGETPTEYAKRKR